MNTLRIFVDFPVEGDALNLLRAETAPHDLIFPRKAATSVLHQAAVDPGLFLADVAFGQPNPGSVGESDRLRWIHLSTSGFARYDNAEFRAVVDRKRIAVSNSAAVYAEACATHLLAFLLAQARGIPGALRRETETGSREWFDLRESCSTLRGETVLILGFGSIGRRLAEMLRPLGMKVLAYRRTARGDEGVPVVTDLESVLSGAEHVVNILPDSGETRSFFDAARFRLMKPGTVYYNIGRGTTTDQGALLGALRSGRLAAAWLDVTDPEPLPEDHPLRAEPHCHITPHIGGGHRNETSTLVRHFVENLRRFERGEPLADRIM